MAALQVTNYLSHPDTPPNSQIVRLMILMQEVCELSARDFPNEQLYNETHGCLMTAVEKLFMVKSSVLRRLGGV